MTESGRAYATSAIGAARLAWGIQWDAMGNLGSIQRRKNGRFAVRITWKRQRYWIGTVPAIDGLRVPIESEDLARRVLEHIRSKVAEGKPLETAIAPFVSKGLKSHEVLSCMDQWREYLAHLVKTGDGSFRHADEVRAVLEADDSHFAYWEGWSVFDVNFAAAEAWSIWMADRGLGSKSRKNFLGYLHAMLGWLHERDRIPMVPRFPKVPQVEHSPTLLARQDLEAVLAAVDAERRGVFLAMAHGLRPSEARALDLSDYKDGWLRITKAMKGLGPTAPIGPTKNRRNRTIPVTDELARWIEARKRRARSPAEPLFLNPKGRKSDRWSHHSLQTIWRRACLRAGVAGVALYEGTKHSWASDRLDRGASIKEIQEFLGHADIRSTERYAKLRRPNLIRLVR